MLSHALIKATAKDYVREIQIRLILEPIADRLLTTLVESGRSASAQMAKPWRVAVKTPVFGCGMSRTSDKFNLFCIGFVNNGVIKYQLGTLMYLYFIFHIPNKIRGYFLLTQITVDSIIAEIINVIRKIS